MHIRRGVSFPLGCFLLVICLLRAASDVTTAQAQQAPTVLTSGTEVRREMHRTEPHEYALALNAGQFAEVRFATREIVGVLHVAVFDPQNQRLTDVEYLLATRFMTVGWRAAQSGLYRLKVTSAARHKSSFPYHLRVIDVRAFQTNDQTQLTFQQVLTAVSTHNGSTAKADSERHLMELNALEQLPLTPYQTIDVLTAIGIVQRELQRRTEAVATFERALALAQQTDDGFIAPFFLASLADIAVEQLQYSKARELYQAARQAARASGNRFFEGFVAMNSARIFKLTDELGAVLENYQRAYECFLGERDESGWLMALNNLGIIYTEIGEYQSAFDAYQRVLQAPAASQRPLERYTAEIGLAFAYWHVSELAAARTHYQRARALADDMTTRGQTLSGLGAVALILGEVADAEKLFNEALPALRASRDTRNEALTLGGLAWVAETRQDWPQALKLYQEGLTLARRSLDRYLEGLALAKIGNLQRQLGQLAEAQVTLKQALEHSQKIRDRQVETEANFALAQLAHATGERAAAQRYSATTLDLIETQRQKVASLDLRATYFASLNQPYEFYLQLLQEEHQRAPQAGFAARALEISERARSRSLLEMLAERGVDLRADAPPELVTRERELQRALNATNEQQFKLLSQLHLKSQADEVRQRLDKLTLELQEVQSQLRSASPRLAALTAPQPLRLAALQAQLDDETTLLEYALGERHSYLWVVTKTALHSYELAPRAAIEAQALRVRRLLTARQPVARESAAQRAQRLAAADAELPPAAAQLSQMLLAPAAANLQTPRLAIVADGALQYVSFAALPLPAKFVAKSGSALPPTSAPLITQFELVNLPSASALALLRQEIQGRAPARKTLAVFADPVFEADDPRLTRGKKPLSPLAAKPKTPSPNLASDLATTTFLPSSLSRSQLDLRLDSNETAAALSGDHSSASGFSRLLASRREANRLLALVPAEQRLAALDFKADRATALQPQLGQFRLLHFATHGVLNEIHPDLSGIVLSLRDEAGQEQDGFLRLHEIYNLKLNADLVTLSACQTGLGKQVRGEGLIGLTRGFMFAGVPRVAASLWKVQDDSTAELMHEFYRALLRDGQRPAAALRAAQLALQRQAAWQHPFYWAAFTLQGEWR